MHTQFSKTDATLTKPVMLVMNRDSCVAGKHVLVVNGAYRGSEAVLTVVDEKNFCCSIKIETVSKIHT